MASYRPSPKARELRSRLRLARGGWAEEVGSWWLEMWRHSSVQKTWGFFPTNLGLNFGCSFLFFHHIASMEWFEKFLLFIFLSKLRGFSLSRILLRSMVSVFKVRGVLEDVFVLVAMIQWWLEGHPQSPDGPLQTDPILSSQRGDYLYMIYIYILCIYVYAHIQYIYI